MQPTLVFDADDTLWDEQGVLQAFEADIEALLDRLCGRPSHFRERFIATEHANIPTLGYGFASYIYSVGEAVSSVAAWRRHKDEVLARVAELIADIQTAGPRVIDGVVPTLELLANRRYRMVLLTRGIDHEQRHKLARSGLSPFFSDIRVVGRKDVDTYRLTAEELGDPAALGLCMIGNSMRSDVGPALEAGWRAIHVPPPTEWAHDQADGIAVARFRRASGFRDVAELVQCAEFWG
jgi:putative hydrolase of the HAD superfamily